VEQSGPRQHSNIDFQWSNFVVISGNCKFTQNYFARGLKKRHKEIL